MMQVCFRTKLLGLAWIYTSFSIHHHLSPEISYNTPSTAPKVVINDWNILLGQRPVRLSLQYDHIVPVSNLSVTARLPVAQLIRDDRPVTERTELKDLRAQDGGVGKCWGNRVR